MVLIQSLGVSSLFAYSNRLRNAIELALVSFLVIFLASAINLILYRGLLAPLGLEYLALLCFVGVSSILTLLVLHSLEKYFPLSMRRQRLAFYLIAGNSSIIGLSLLNTASERSRSESTRLNSSHKPNSDAVFCVKKKRKTHTFQPFFIHYRL